MCPTLLTTYTFRRSTSFDNAVIYAPHEYIRLIHLFQKAFSQNQSTCSNGLTINTGCSYLISSNFFKMNGKKNYLRIVDCLTNNLQSIQSHGDQVSLSFQRFIGFHLQDAYQ